MANISVTTAAVFIDSDAYPDIGATRQTLVVQNLGPDDLYLDYVADAVSLTTANGIKLVTGAIWEIQSYDPNRPVAVISAGTSDVRYTAFD